MNTQSEKLNEIQFSDIFDIVDIQRIQDLFADATGVASIITKPDGTPITRPSNFCRLCNEIIRKTEIGLTNCFKSDSEIGKPDPYGPIIKPCLSGSLWDAGASIIVGGKHIANWLIGQVRNEAQDQKQMLQYANDIGADREDFMIALREVPVMSKEKFEKIAQMLYAFASEISSKAYQNTQLILSVMDRLKAEEDLEKERNLLRTLIDNMPDRIYAKDLKSQFIICNAALVKRMGLTSPDDIIGKTDFDFVKYELARQYFDDEQNIISTGIPLINHIESMGDISGKIRWNLATKVALHDNEGNIIGIVGMGRDITERKEAEDEIKLKNNLLQVLNAEKDKFFSIIAHDLRGPLSSFVAATQIITEEIHTMPMEEIKDITMSMKASATGIYSLLENLLEWSTLRRGRIDFIPEKINLRKKVLECVDVLSESSRNKEIEIGINIPDDIEIFADNHMFDAIVRNLVSNALKFTIRGGKVTVSSIINTMGLAEVTVTDSGIGMTTELKDKLFKLSEKTSRPGTEGEPSTGLGLLLCKEFIEKNGGEIWVESEVGQGSTFYFSLPVEAEEKDESQKSK